MKNREIKFRVWDETTSNPKMLSWDYLKQAPCENVFIASEDITLMQFINLKDKNGKEIYEGDIVKCERILDETSTDTHIGIVEWDTIHCNIYFKSIKNEISRCVGGKEVIEIIGNIHENPDLLK